MTKRLGMPSKAVTNSPAYKKRQLLAKWDKLFVDFGSRRKSITKGKITEREMKLLFATTPKTQANFNKLNKLLK